MKKVSLTLMLLLGTSLGFPILGIAQKTKERKVEETLVVGVISDSQCGLKHMAGMADDKTCTLMCVKGGGKFVLADPEHLLVYKLDKSGQKKAREFPGQKVAVTGRITGKTIHVISIAPAT
jgi:hypothetical protein